jgi:hypothetical protein
MSVQTQQVECVPAFRARAGINGVELGFRTKYVGFAIQAGWRWLGGGPWTLWGWDVYVDGQKFFNGPRSWSLGSIAGFLRLRFGFDAILFTGQRDPAIEAQIAAAQEQFKQAIMAQLAAQKAAEPKVIEAGAPIVEKVLPGEDGLTVE